MTPMLDNAIIEDKYYGRAAPSLGWVPAPRFLLRRAVLLATFDALPRGRVLEIGCGAGSLIADLEKRGFSCTAVETSQAARALASRMLGDFPEVRVHQELDPAWAGYFDYLLAFEVLEHIEDDEGVLRQWLRTVRSGGRVLLSMPAHARRWTATDTWAGHVRRYDRSDMIALAENSGLRVLRCQNYGYPLANLLEPLNAWVHAWQLRRGGVSRSGGDAPESSEQVRRDVRSGESGVRRTAETRMYPLLTSWLGRRIMSAAFRVQNQFRDSERGNGFVLEAAKP